MYKQRKEVLKLVQCAHTGLGITRDVMSEELVAKCVPLCHQFSWLYGAVAQNSTVRDSCQNKVPEVPEDILKLLKEFRMRRQGPGGTGLNVMHLCTYLPLLQAPPSSCACVLVPMITFRSLERQ